MPVFDYAKLAAPALKAQLSAALRLHGWDADVYKMGTDRDSVYKDIMPEEGSRRLDESIKVILGERISGANISDFISVMGQQDEERILIALYALEETMILEVLAPDGREMKLEVLNSSDLHQQSAFAYKYYVRLL